MSDDECDSALCTCGDCEGDRSPLEAALEMVGLLFILALAAVAGIVVGKLIQVATGLEE